ncbi:MAG: SH3 domain-containing protein [Lachnospiraceae bacterium]|nr:SH3 domain-containing protein [Candidatus Minthocola equi]
MSNKRRLKKIIVMARACTMLVQTTTSYATEVPSAGIENDINLLTSAEAEPCFAPSIDLEELAKQSVGVPKATAADIREEMKDLSELTPAQLAKKQEELSVFGTIGVVNVSMALNVRRQPSENSEVVGKLYQNSGVIIGNYAGENNEWTYITSGAVCGWVLSSYIVTGDLARSLYNTMKPKVGSVVTHDVKVYKKADKNSDVLVVVDLHGHYPVLGYEGDFVKLQITANDIGYIHFEYVAVSEGLCVGVKVQDDYDLEDLVDELEASRRNAKKSSGSSSKKSGGSSSGKSGSSSSSSGSGSSGSSSGSGSSGSSSNGWRYVGSFTITAYCTDCNSPKGSRQTYSGASAKEWYTAAINMNGSPLDVGDTVKIDGYGTFKIQDVGSSPYGSNWIDIFVYPDECSGTFSRNVDVWVKE